MKRILHITTAKFERPTGNHFAGIQILFEDKVPTKMRHWSSLPMCSFCGAFSCYITHSVDGVMNTQDLVGLGNNLILVEWQDVYQATSSNGSIFWPLTEDAQREILLWVFDKKINL
jgi:hypothetical protein